MDRVGVGARIINGLPGIKSVLDVGCRDALLADKLDDRIEYHGADLERASPRVTYVGDFAEMNFDRTFSVVVALDILEHTELPAKNFDKLCQIADKHVIVSLPNCADLLTRLRFFRKGRLGGKYEFDGTDPLDRHRWVMNHGEIVRFFRKKAAEHDLKLELIELTYGSSGRPSVTSRIGRAFSQILPKSWATGTVIAVLSKAA